MKQDFRGMMALRVLVLVILAAYFTACAPAPGDKLPDQSGITIGPQDPGVETHQYEMMIIGDIGTEFALGHFTVSDAGVITETSIPKYVMTYYNWNNIFYGASFYGQLVVKTPGKSIIVKFYLDGTSVLEQTIYYGGNGNYHYEF